MNPEVQTAPAALGEALVPEAPIGSMALPHDLTPWGMFVNADIVVQAIMVSLFVASIVTWTVLLAKGIELILAGRAARAAADRLSNAGSLFDAAERTNRKASDIAVMIGAAVQEIHRSADLPSDGIKERIASLLDQIEAAARRRMQRGIGILATIGATAPFIGLFGTVWGIMNSFIGISKAQTTNLAIVAPGIAEALLATALGLIAAIPAVVIYNLFTRLITNYRAQLADAGAGIKRLVSRDLDRPRASFRVAAQ